MYLQLYLDQAPWALRVRSPVPNLAGGVLGSIPEPQPNFSIVFFPLDPLKKCKIY